MNFMSGSGKQMKDTSDMIIVSGVMLTTTLHAILTANSQTLTILTVDNVTLDVSPAGDQQNFIVFLVPLMASLLLIMKEEQFVPQNAGTVFNPSLTKMTSGSVTMEII